MTDDELANKLMAMSRAFAEEGKPKLAEVAKLGAARIRELASRVRT